MSSCVRDARSGTGAKIAYAAPVGRYDNVRTSTGALDGVVGPTKAVLAPTACAALSLSKLPRSCFILIDEADNQTVAAGMILDQDA
jgi:hypothetical protein